MGIILGVPRGGARLRTLDPGRARAARPGADGVLILRPWFDFGRADIHYRETLSGRLAHARALITPAHP